MSQSKNLDQQSQKRASALLVVLVLLSVFLVGCGTNVYKQRLKETEGYYRYLEKVDSALTKNPWESGTFGLEIRVPKQFRLMPKPKMPVRSLEEEESSSEGLEEANGDESENEQSNEEGSESEEAESTEEQASEDESVEEASYYDPRQPSFLDAPLPGLVAAWQAKLDVDTDTEGNELTSRPAFIYLLSNHQRLLDREKDNTIKPLEFLEDVSDALAEGLRITADTPEDPWTWKSQDLPRGHSFVPPKKFNTVTITPEDESDDVLIDFQLYQMKTKDIRLVLLYVIPQDVSRSERINDGITLSLESLKVSPKNPKRKRTTTSKSGKSKGRSGPSF